MQTYWLHVWYGIVYIMYIMSSIIDRSILSSDLNISIYFHYTYLYQASIATGLSQALGSPTSAKDCSMLQHLLQSGTVVPPWAQRLQARARCITGTIRLQSSHCVCIISIKKLIMCIINGLNNVISIYEINTHINKA